MALWRSPVSLSGFRGGDDAVRRHVGPGPKSQLETDSPSVCCKLWRNYSIFRPFQRQNNEHKLLRSLVTPPKPSGHGLPEVSR